MISALKTKLFRVRKINKLVSLCCAIGWPDYLFNNLPFASMTICPKVKKITKVVKFKTS